MDNQQQILRGMEKLSAERRQNECMKIIESAKFLNDPFISVIFEQAITLGYNIDIIKEIFCEFLIELNFKPINLEKPNFEELINADKFIDRLVIKSSQYEFVKQASFLNINNISNKIDANDDFDDNEELLNMNDEDLQSNNMNEFDSINNHIDLNSLKEKNMKTNQLIKKSMNEQQKIQKEQEFRNELQKRINDPSNLKPIIIDCKDVALSDTHNKQTFLVIRIKKVVEYFEKKNHKIYAILSQSRRDQIMAANTANNLQPKTPDQQILLDMESKSQIHYTPNKRVGAKRIDPDEDIVKLQFAHSKGGIIVSNNNFKKYLNHSEDFKKVIEEAVLMYSFIDDTFMPVEDPLGKGGPSLENFLRIEPSVSATYWKKCPYKKKCTYGAKCKYWHPERERGSQQFKSAFQSLQEQAKESLESFNNLRLEVVKNQPEQYVLNPSSLLTKKISISPPVLKETNDKIDENFDYDLNSDPLTFNSMSITSQIQQKKYECGPMLRAMGPEATSYELDPILREMHSEHINNKSSNNKKLSNLLAKETENLTDLNLFSPKDFLERYGSSTFNNLEDYSMRNSNVSSDESIRGQLIKKLSESLADQVMKKYPKETDIEKLIYLSRCLATSEDDF